MASSISWNFLRKLLSGVRKSILLSCWVKVLAPCVLRHSSRSLLAARMMPRISTPTVALKVPVLDGNHRVAQDGRNLVVGHDDAVLQGKAADGRAVVRVDFRHHIRAVILQLAHLGEVGRVNKNQSPQRADSGGEKDQNQENKLAEDLPAAHARWRVTTAGARK